MLRGASFTFPPGISAPSRKPGHRWQTMTADTNGDCADHGLVVFAEMIRSRSSRALASVMTPFCPRSRASNSAGTFARLSFGEQEGRELSGFVANKRCRLKSNFISSPRRRTDPVRRRKSYATKLMQDSSKTELTCSVGCVFDLG